MIAISFLNTKVSVSPTQMSLDLTYFMLRGQLHFESAPLTMHNKLLGTP